jgi:hypothetical protein
VQPPLLLKVLRLLPLLHQRLAAHQHRGWPHCSASSGITTTITTTSSSGSSGLWCCASCCCCGTRGDQGVFYGCHLGLCIIDGCLCGPEALRNPVELVPHVVYLLLQLVRGQQGKVVVRPHAEG